jgi:hypothetical protein
MSKPLWTFEGFETDAGNQVVQEWYWSDIGIDQRDDIRTRVAYIENVEQNLWKEPHFKFFGDIGEIRKRTPVGALRVYGYFPADRPHVFVILNGDLKKSDKDRQGVETARLRLKKLQQGRGRTHGFDFDEKPANEIPPEQDDETPSSIQ